jgi:hypothetical protein
MNVISSGRNSKILIGDWIDLEKEEPEQMVSKIVLFIKDLDEKQILWILLGITFGLRLYAVLMAKGISYDSAAYGFIARDFLKHNFAGALSSALHPFYPFLIYLVSPDPYHVEIAGRFISLFFGTLTLIPVFYLVKEVAGQKEAVLSGLFYSVHPYLVTYSGMLLSEATYWGLLTFSVYFFWMGLKRRKLLGLTVSGLFLALAYLTRPEGIGYLFLLLIWVILDGGMKERWFKKMALIGALFLPLFILTLPYPLYIYRETGQWVISKKLVGVQSYFLRGEREESSSLPARIGEKQEPAEKSSKVLKASKNVIQFFPFTMYHYLRAYHFALWLFLFFGLIRERRKGIKGELFLASFIFFHLFSLSIFSKSEIRLSVPIIPISLFWAGAGVLEIQRYLQKMRISTSGKWVSFLIILAILVQLPQSMRPERRHRADSKSIGLWIKENTPKDSIIMSNSPLETFYGDREFVLLPTGVYTPRTPTKSYNEIIQFAKEKKVRYILINKNTRESNPDFEGSIRSADLREFYRYQKKDGNWITIYEVIY